MNITSKITLHTPSHPLSRLLLLLRIDFRNSNQARHSPPIQTPQRISNRARRQSFAIPAVFHLRNEVLRVEFEVHDGRHDLDRVEPSDRVLLTLFTAIVHTISYWVGAERGMGLTTR